MKRYEPKFPHGEHGACRALTELTIDHLPRDAALGRLRSYRRNGNIWKPDDRADRLYFLTLGLVSVVATDADGREVLIRRVEEGEPFGELCFCGGPTEVRRTTAVAASKSEALEIRLADFMDYLQSEPDALTAAIFTFCIRLAEAENRIEILALHSAEERLCRLLLSLARRSYDKQGRTLTEQQDEVILPVSHHDLARMAAMSRQHVTITMGRLRRQGLVSYERGRPLVVKTMAISSYLSDGRR